MTSQRLYYGESHALRDFSLVIDEAEIVALLRRQEHGSQERGRLLSGGEQQMLAIARTLTGSPEVLLVDEPTEGLAPLMVKEVRARRIRGTVAELNARPDVRARYLEV